MTKVMYEFDSGPEGAAITTGNTGATTVSLAGGSGTFTSAAAYSGDFGVRFAYTADNANPVMARVPPTAPNSQMSTVMAFKFDTVGTQSATVGIWRSSGGALYNLRVIDTGSGVRHLQVFSSASGSTLLFDIGEIDPDTWYRVTSVINGTSGDYTFRLYEGTTTTPLYTASGVSASLVGTVAFLQIGQSAVLSSSVNLDMDYVGLDDGSTTEIGPPSIVVDVHVAFRWNGTQYIPLDLFRWGGSSYIAVEKA